MKSWLRQHRSALAAAFSQLRHAPGSFLFNVLVVAIALALPFAGLTLLENVRPVALRLAVEPEISLFMGVDTPRARSIALATPIRDILRSRNKAAKIEFIPRDKALEQMKQKSGLTDVITTLGANPLPDGYVLTLDGFDNAADAARIESIATQLKALPDVETVQVDSAWVKRLAALMHVLRIALLFLAGTLAVVVIAVVFNTIRLQVLTQVDEIALSRLIGATDDYIHRPFYYAGALLGLCAGGVALAAVALALLPLNVAIGDFARLYASQFQLAPLGLTLGAGLLAVSAALGLTGAALSVQRHLANFS
ncbi:cell division protein FtsX [Undibacterium arcticum]|uniref:Cell division protein FtsX n=1 Tax=Undibacterium arcticum TaxID=1762892 RepID=A0ABV7F0F0_9BURK